MSTNGDIELRDRLEGVESRETFVEFLTWFLQQANVFSWEHSTAASYLDAVIAVADGLDCNYQNRGILLPREPSWRILAEILVIATIYE